MHKVRFGSLIRGIRNRHVNVLAKSISILEHNFPASKLRKELVHYVNTADKTSRGRLIGITGAAGSGKSTLIAALAKLMRRQKKKVAVIAVDPTSSHTGGAFLGDRVRMQALTEDPGIFIRSMASRGAQGGIARATKDAARLLKKAGFDFVLIETVGAGQLDYDVAKFCAMTVLVLTPESGDEMQFMKAGIREVADVFVLNKADRSGARNLEAFLRQSQSDSKHKIPVFKTIAEQGKGVESLYQFIAK